MSKFDSPETEALYEITLNGFHAEECGDVESTNWYGLINGPFDEKPLKGYAGGIVEQTSQGFVNGEMFKSKKALQKKWKEISKMVDASENSDVEGDNPFDLPKRFRGKEDGKAGTYAIIVGNIGTVLETPNLKEAHEAFREYVTQSRKNYGRAAGEDVVLTEGGEPLSEHRGSGNNGDD